MEIAHLQEKEIVINTKRFVVMLVVLSIVLLSVGCAPSAEQIQQAIKKTQDAMPTPYPTYTPLPTYTPVPTSTPIPQVPGIDKPVYVSGVTFKFYSAIITTEPVSIGTKTLTANPGYSVVALRAYYTGDIIALFSGSYDTAGAFYITAADGVSYDWVHLSWDGTSTTIGFFVKTDAPPYVLHNTIDTPWQVDLTSLLNK